LNISNVCSLLDKDLIVVHIVPLMQKLVSDVSEHVRSSLASVVNKTAGILGKEETIRSLLPLLLLLLRDDSSEVLFSSYFELYLFV
jgi:serine/threonine-protein phosphatase 2A regulatory subunit A